MKVLDTILNDMGFRMQSIILEELSRYGSLKDSTVVRNPDTIKWNVDDKNEEYEMVLGFPDWVWIENGRAGNKKMPPIRDKDGSTPILDWMKRKGIPKEAHFVIRKTIGVRGIKARPFLDSALKSLKPELNEEIMSGAKEVIIKNLNNIINKVK